MKIAPGIRALLLAMLFVLTRSAVSAQTLPSPWASTDIGNPEIAGRSTYSSGTFTITAAGSDIWGTSDQLHFVYRPITGDVEIIARISSITTQAHRWAKSGVMIRESLTAQSRHAMMIGSAAAGFAFQRRVQTAGSSDSTAGPASNPPGWVRLVRKADLFSAYFSTNGVNWQLVGSDTIPMGDTVYVGLPTTSHNKTVAATATLDSIKIIAATLPNEPPAISITAPAANSQYTAPASIVINATATDPENAMLSVDFYANQTLILRDTTAPYSATFTTSTAGSYSLTAVAHDADGNSTTSGAVPVTVQSPGNQVPTVSLTSPANGAQFSAPATIDLAANASDPENQLARVEFLSGTTVLGTDTTAPYSFSWTNVTTGTYSLTAKAYDTAGAMATSSAVSVTVTGSGGALPAGQTAADIGSPAIAGRTGYASPGIYTIDAAGRDIWDASDQFHFVYQSLSGDMEVIARVASLTNTDPWSKAGVMIRETLAAGSRHAMTIISPGNGYSFQRRPQTASTSIHTTTGTGTGTAPGWVRLVRTGNQFQSYRSADGVTWTLIGSDTVTMNATVFVGLAVSSHNVTTAARAVIDNFRAQGTSGNGAPSVTLTAPANGATFTAPATVNLTANASDPENQLARVEFLSGTTVLGTDTTAPYSFSWTNVAAGTYTLTARAYDGTGASATSAAATVTVGSPNAPPTAALTSPASGATFTAPATINLAANASDPENQLARVEFLSGTTVLGTDTTAPYSFSWTNVAAGTYSLTAKAYDTAGAVATSAAVSVTVTATTGGLPAGQTAADIGAPAVAGRTTYASGTYTIDGAGVDIWSTSDQFQFVYQSMTGDVEVIARVASLTNTDPWSKAGVMIRETLAANSRHAIAVVTPANGYSFQRRLQPGGFSEHTTTGAGAAPGWVRLLRTGSQFQAFWSGNGSTWTLIGSTTITMNATVFVGLAVTSHNPATSARAVIDSFRAQAPTANGAPSVTLTGPANGATFTAPATINLTANASDPENQLARVEFFSGATLVGTDTTAPYSFSWGNVAAGTYSLTARAYDTAGASATSAAVTVTVSGTSSGPPTTVVFTASADHSTNVTSYLLSVYTAGADPATATPVATSDLGKPTPAANNDITVDRATFFSALAPGNYIATITAIGPGGQTRSAPVSFTR